jgi:hypothetical protein
MKRAVKRQKKNNKESEVLGAEDVDKNDMTTEMPMLQEKRMINRTGM